MQFELKCHMPQLTRLYCLTCKQWGFARDKSTIATILMPCPNPISTLNESLFSFTITQVTTVNILYVSCRLKLHRIYKTVSLVCLSRLSVWDPNSIKGWWSHSLQQCPTFAVLVRLDRLNFFSFYLFMYSFLKAFFFFLTTIITSKCTNR